MGEEAAGVTCWRVKLESNIRSWHNKAASIACAKAARRLALSSLFTAARSGWAGEKAYQQHRKKMKRQASKKGGIMA